MHHALLLAVNPICQEVGSFWNLCNISGG